MLEIKSNNDIEFTSKIEKQNKLELETKSLTKNNKKAEVDYAKVFKSVDDFLDLGKAKSFNPSELNEAEKEKYIQVIAKLMKKGIVGYHYYEKNGKVKKRFIETEIGDNSIDERDRIINGKKNRDVNPHRNELKQNGVQINYELNLEYQESINVII